jgi:hypothetical protein
LSICAEYATSTCTITIQAEGGNTGIQVTITQEVGSARVTETGAAGMIVVGQQHGEVTHDSTVDLDQLQVGYIPGSGVIFLPGGRIWEAFLKPITNTEMNLL